MIEEMARAMCPNSKEWTCKACSGSAKPDCDAYENAEKLVNAGCRIIAEDSVVLSKEEFEFMCVDTKKVREEEVNKARKETAEKILKWLVETGVINTAPDTTKMYFKEEFGIEVEECLVI